MESFCPILGREVFVDETPYSQGDWKIVRCRETGFVFLANPPDYSQLNVEFAWEKTSTEERQRRKADEPVVQAVAMGMIRMKHAMFPKRNPMWSVTHSIPHVQNSSQPLKFLDIGCAAGGLMIEFCERAKAAGHQVVPYGIEVSKQLAHAASKTFNQLGGRVVEKCAVDGVSDLTDGSIDVAVLRCFLEHECQPLELLKRLRTALSDRGSVVIKVPNFNCLNRRLRGRRWCGFRYPDHVNYFTPRTLTLLARNAGFRVTRQRFKDKLPTSDNMYAVLEKSNNAGQITPPLHLAAQDRAAA